MNQPTMQPAPALRRARSALLEGSPLPTGLIGAPLEHSWQRSLAAGLNPTGRLYTDDHLSHQELQRALARHHDLLAHSQPVMEYLFEQVRHSHSMVILADNRGTLMHTLGEADFLGKAERVALQAGANWHEQRRGTNAIGTALAETQGVEIHGAEHFLERNTFLTCAAAPILTAGGELLGILDISGDQRSRHPHTLGLVQTAASMIENRLITAQNRRAVRLHLHTRAEGIGTLTEGILVLSEDGWITGANRPALRLLGIDFADLAATPLSRCLQTRIESLLAAHHRHPGQILPLRRHDGQLLFAQVFADKPALHPQSPPASEPAPARQDALSRLDDGDSRWRSAADKARRVLGKPIPIILHGESGVGKELFAQAIHRSGPRADKPFVAINCAALPENLIESELFGYVPGAFTGARKEGNPGRLREADGGTLFLDEIGDMPLVLQSRLLRVLQERQVTPVGGGRAVAVDFALICASHRNLQDEVAAGRFRSDLYYRLNGMTLRLPALREREDFPALTERLLAELAPAQPLLVAPDLLARLSAYDWPGNLRQYANALRTAIAMLDSDETCIDWRHLPDDLFDALQTPSSPPIPLHTHAETNLASLSQTAIRHALDTCQGNYSLAARLLGISRQTLYRKLAKQNIQR